MLQSHSGNMSNMANISTSQTDTSIAISLYGLIWDAIFFFFKIYFMAFVPLIDSAVKSGTGNERERSWGVDRRNVIGPASNPCSPWASSPKVVGATGCATVPPWDIFFHL